jgi:hypothetical protein
MTKTPQELADYLKNYNCWRRGSYLHEQPVQKELGEAIDQVIAILEDLPLSDCCQAPAVVAGKPGSTQWHVCPQCCQPCNVYYLYNEPVQPQ